VLCVLCYSAADDLKDVVESDESEAENCTLSSSDSDDNLMVSQELRPGFSSVSPEGMDNSDELTDSERHLDLAMDVLGGTIIEGTLVKQSVGLFQYHFYCQTSHLFTSR